MECPTCGDEFDTEQGMKQHHAKTHGESIAGVEVVCSVCGDNFRKQRAHAEAADRHFCSESCKSEGYKNRVTLTCDYCGGEYERKKSRVSDSENTFCSNECQGKHRREHTENSQTLHRECEVCGDEFTIYKSDAERYSGTYCSWDCWGEEQSVEYPTVACANCGEEIQRPPSSIERFDSFYCSIGCRGAHQTHMNHPMWAGGKGLTEAVRSMISNESWTNRRAELLEKRGGECRMCGHESESLHLHHIIPLLAGGTNDPELLIFVCTECHQRVEAHARETIDHTVSRLAREFAE